jgi:tetratricopeptide (TPR) repeat protein
MGFCRLRAERYDDAAEFFRRASEAGSVDFRVSFRLGEFRLRALALSGAPNRLDADYRRRIEDARAVFRRCLELNPHFSEARGALGRSYLLEDASAAREGIPVLEAAVIELPSRTDLALDLARLYARAGDSEKSDAISKRVLGPNARSMSGKSSVDLLARVNLLLEQGKDDEAVHMLEGMVEKSSGGVREEFTAQLEALRRGVARNRSIRTYNEALEHWNRRDLEGALALLRTVAATAEDPVLAQSAREKIPALEKALAPKKRTTPRSG